MIVPRKTRIAALAPAPSADVRLSEDGLDALLGYQLARAAIRTTEAFATIVGTPLEMRKLEFTALQLVARNPGSTATQVARALSITVPGITVWLDKLEHRGLIVRERSGTDRRTQHLTVTAEGERVVSSALARLLSAEAALLQASLTPGERQLLLELLQKFARGGRAGG